MKSTKIAATMMVLLSIGLWLLVFFNRVPVFWGDFGIALISVIVFLTIIGAIHEWLS